MNKRLVSLVVVMTMLCAFVPAVARAYDGTKYGDYLYYRISGNTVTITDCDESAVNVEIPSTIYGKSVTEIGYQAFDGCCSLRYITIPSSVLSVGESAFSNCFLLRSTMIPGSVTSIGNSGLYESSSLTDVYYSGTEAQWKVIDIDDSNNDCLNNATIHYNSSGGAAAVVQGIDATAQFCYTIDGRCVNFSLDGTLRLETAADKSIIIACYDMGALVKTEIVNLDKTVNGIALNDFSVELPYVPDDLTVKTFAWSDFGECVPLCGAAVLTDVPASAFKVTGRAVSSEKNDSGLDSGMVNFRIETSENFDGYIYDGEGYYREEYMYIGGTDIDKHLLEVVEAYIIKDENDEFEIIKYTPIDEIQAITLAKSDIDSENTTEEKIVTVDGREFDIAPIEGCYINGVATIWNNSDVIDFIADMPEKYGTIKLIDNYSATDHKGDGEYDNIFIDCYYKATVDLIVHSEDSDAILFSDWSEGMKASLVIEHGDDWFEYNYINEYGRKCDISELDNYEGKDIYIAYDITGYFSNSCFYDIILEGAEAADNTLTHENSLNGAESAVVLKYSEDSKTAFLEGDLRLDCDGNMPYEINISIMNGDDTLETEAIKTSTLINKIVFGYESGTRGDYSVQAHSFILDKKPDKAVISFGKGTAISDIIVPVVDADTYKVCGRVIGTRRTDAGIEGNQVRFIVEKADSFDNMWINAARYADISEYTAEMYFEDTDATKLLLIYSQAYIKKNADGEYTIQAIMPLVSNVVTLSAEDFDDSRSDFDNNLLYFYPDGETKNSVKYQLDNDVSYYINGVYTNMTNANFSDLIYQNPTASITLYKEAKMGSTSVSPYYNSVMIDVYGTAVVENVTEENGTYVVDFYNMSNGIAVKMIVDTTDRNSSCRLVLDGSPIMLSELKPGDILSIAYDMTERFGESPFYDIIVSRAVVSGRCTSVSGDGEEYTIDNVQYKSAAGMGISPVIGEEYDFYLDCFGRVALVEEHTASQ